MTPNNPFESNPNARGASYGEAPPKKSKAKFWLLGCGITGVLGFVVCCGGGVAVTQFGLTMLAGEFKKQLDGNPVIVEHIGDIESLEMSWSDTFAGAQNADGGAEELAFQIKGTKGSGVVMIQQDQSGDGTGMESATLVMEDGSRFPIDLGQFEPGLGVDGDPPMDDIFGEGELPFEDAEPAKN